MDSGRGDGDALSEGGYSAGSRSGETPRQSAAWLLVSCVVRPVRSVRVVFFPHATVCRDTRLGWVVENGEDVYCR